jgi:outer membrane receptor protein involved in Fe transport
MRAQRIVCILLLLLAVASQAGAQFANASLGGTVTGNEGGGLPGVSVTAKNAASGLVRTTVTAADGSYSLTGLKPGTYEVTFELAGFRTVGKKDVELRVGQETRLGVTLEVGHVEETITVTSDAPIIETTSKEIGGTLTNQEFLDLPSQNHSFALFAALLPGVVPVPATESTSADAIFANGQDDNNNAFYVDGANNDDDVIGARAGAQARTAIEAIQEFQVLTSQFDAEFGRSTGAILNAVTKSGGNQFTGSAFGYFQRSTWNQTGFFMRREGKSNPDSKFNSLGGTLGGPIVHDKLHFFVSYEDDLDQAGVFKVFSDRPELNYSTTTDNKIKNELAKVDYQISSTNHLAARYLRETSPQFNQIIDAGSSQATLEAAREEADTDSTWVATLDSVLSSTGLNETRLSFTKEDVAFANPAFNGNGKTFAAERNQAPVEVRPGILDGGSGVAQARVNRSKQLDDTFSYFFPDFHGEHQVKAGFQYAKRDEVFGDFGTANGQFTFLTNNKFDSKDLSTYPTSFLVRIKGGLDAPIPSEKTLGVFLQDDWRITNRLTLNLGLRYDKEDATKDNNDYAPRLGFAWDPTGKGKTVVRGGWGRFYDRFQLGFYQDFFQDAIALTQGFTVRYPDGAALANQKLLFDLAQANGVTTLAGLRDFLIKQLESGSGTSLNIAPTVDNPNRKEAYVDTASLGAEHELLPGLSVALDLVHSENKDTLLLVDLNPFSQALGGRPNISIVNGKVTPLNSISTYVNAGHSTQDSAQFALVKRFNGHFGGRLSYTYSRSSGNYGNAGAGTASAYFQTRTKSGYNFDTGQFIGDPLDLNLDDPRNDGQPVNWLRPHNLVLSGTYVVPHTGWGNSRGLVVSGIFRYLSGDRTTILSSNFLDNGNRAPAPAGTYSGNGASDITLKGISFDGKLFGAEQPDFKRLDLSLRYELPVVRGVSIALLGEVYNLTSEANFASVGNNIYNPATPTNPKPPVYLTPTAVNNPAGRSYQLGARLSF